MKTNENAFTGLEAAIVLIAFVVVAAVFSYVMLGAGFFTAQKSQEVVHTGIGQASSSIEVVGDVYGIADAEGDNTLKTIRFNIGLTSGMSPMNISAMRVNYADASTRSEITFDGDNSVAAGGDAIETFAGSGWIIKRVENRDFDKIDGDDRVLRPGEKFLLEMSVTPAKNTRFTITMQPEVGALTTIVRTVPPSIYPVNILR